MAPTIEQRAKAAKDFCLKYNMFDTQYNAIRVDFLLNELLKERFGFEGASITNHEKQHLTVWTKRKMITL